MGENAMYRLDTDVMVRIGRSESDAAKEVRVAEWLADADLPAVRLADGHTVPIQASGFSVTFWEFLNEADAPATALDLAGVLRGLHTLPASKSLNLPTFEPMPKVRERISNARGGPVSENDIEFLEKRRADLEEAYAELDFSLPVGVIHGDAHPGNLLRTTDGEILLIDFEDFAWGPREWDISVTAVRYQAFGWLNRSEYDSYAETYGFDPLSWSGFPVMRAIRELNMTTWLMQQVDDSDDIATEVATRIADLREDQRPRHWQTF
jgi:thiamine kinase-like enzyme